MEKQIAANNRKTWLLVASMVLLFAAAGGLFAWIYDSYWLGGGVAAFGVAYMCYVYLSAVRKLIKFSGAVEVTKRTHRQAYLLVENMSITLGIPMPKLYVINSPALNAFAAGYTPDKALVGVTTGLLRHLNKQELEGVLAHEMSHIINRDTKIATLVFALLTGIALMARIGYYFGDSPRSSRGGSSSAGVYLAVVILLLLAFLLGRLAQAAISRRREYMADHTGAYITRYPEGLASALRKIQTFGSEIQFKKRGEAASHLFLHSPVKLRGKKLFNIFATHPPIEDRIAALERLKDAGLYA